MIGGELQARPNERVSMGLGTMSECTMALYGICRLLRARELGPKKLLPMVEAFGASAREHCAAVNDLFLDLDRRALEHPDLAHAMDLLRPAVQRIGSDVVDGFGRRLRLGAAERLELERRSERLGGDIQALRDLLQLVDSALDPRAVLLGLGDVLHGPSARPAFVAGTVRCRVAGDVTFYGDPVVSWHLVRHALRIAGAAGREPPVFSLRARDEAGPVIEVGLDPLDGREIELAMPPWLRPERGVVAAVAAHLGIEVTVQGSTVTVTL